MFSKQLAAALLGSALLTGAAFAQATAPATPATVPAPATAPAAVAEPATAPVTWRSSKIVGINVFNAENETLGTINDLLTNDKGVIETVVIGVGGFLGVGEHLVAVPFAELKFSTQPLVSKSVATPAAPATDASSPMAPAAKAPAAPAAKAPAAPATKAEPAKPADTPAATDAPAAAATGAEATNRWVPNHAVLNATKDQLKALTEFKYVR